MLRLVLEVSQGEDLISYLGWRVHQSLEPPSQERDEQEGDRIVGDHIRLLWTVPTFGGRRWWFQCPRTGRRTTKLYLPNGGSHFWSRKAYGLGYACQREGRFDRLQRRAAMLNRQLGGKGWATWEEDLEAPDTIGGPGVQDGRRPKRIARSTSATTASPTASLRKPRFDTQVICDSLASGCSRRSSSIRFRRLAWSRCRLSKNCRVRPEAVEKRVM
jgi:hypothetical protein